MTPATLPRMVAALLVAGLALVSVQRVAAQFGPPSTFLGTVADAERTIEDGMLVEAYVGDTLCSLPSGGPSDSITFPYGEGEGHVTFYIVDVVAAEQIEGCGRDGAEVRIKINGRFANQTGLWRRGLVRMDVTFGDVEPAVQPTQTPTPAAPAESPTPAGGDSQTAEAGGTASSGSPGVATSPPDGGSALSAAQTRPGGLGSSVDATTFEKGGGFPVWGILLIGLGALSLAGGAIGIVAAQRSREDES